MLTNNLPIVLITHELPPDWISLLDEKCTVFTGSADATEMSSELIYLLPKADGLLCLLTIPITESVLSQAPKLCVVSNMAVGVDNIDIGACTRRGIPVGNTPSVLTESTADLTMALLLSIARKISLASRDAREGRWKTWSPAGWLGLELNNSVLGIVGMGKIGKAVARRAIGFGMKIIFTEPDQMDYPSGTQVSFEELLHKSDIVSLHAPLTPDTRRIINKTTLSMMKTTAILVNAARGQLVDTSALYEALIEKTIAAAAIDVTDPEPLPASHPLYNLSNCLVVPHIGSATQTTRRRMAELACENLLAGLNGEPLLHCVNPEVYHQT